MLRHEPMNIYPIPDCLCPPARVHRARLKQGSQALRRYVGPTTMHTYTEQEARRAFGFHLMLDGYRCNAERLDNLTACYDFLDRLVIELGVTKQSPPYLFRTPEQYVDKRGLSGWVPLVESGISLHTLTASRFVSLDVYSCRAFDQQRVIACMQEFFQP